MPDAQPLLREIVAEPEHLATMKAALEEAWQQVASHFKDEPSDAIAGARTALAKAILAAYRSGAPDVLALKHYGLGALKLRYPMHFDTGPDTGRHRRATKIDLSRFCHES